jgi:hypothetical protein
VTTLRKAHFCLAIFLIAVAPLALGQNNPAATIDLPLVPAQAAPGSAGFTLTIHGAGFMAGSTVNWNGSPRATTFVSAAQVTAVINASDLATAETANVTVVNPVPGGGVSNTAYFEVTDGTSKLQYIASSFGLSDIQGGTAVGDFNNDGKLDLAIIEEGSPGTLLLYLGNGDGTFQPALTQDIGNDNPNSVATADFNRDGDLDLVTSNSNGTISVHLGNGDGTFQPRIDTPSGSDSLGVAVGDFNGDGNEDVAVTSNFPPVVAVLLGQGNGTFQPPVGYSVLANPASLVAGDFNNDGELDLAVSGGKNSNNRISVLLGKGDGTFQSAIVRGAGGVGPMVAADFNQDGNLDLAVGYDSYVYISEGEGNGDLNAPKRYPAGEGIAYLQAGDLNGDGLLDLAFSGDGEVGVFPGKGSGEFAKGQLFSGLGSGTGALAVGDFNNDGSLDVGTNIGVLIATAASVSPTSLSFGSQLVGTVSTPQTVTLTNYGRSPLHIFGISIRGQFAQTNSCGTRVPPVGSCTISVTFAPLRLGGLAGTLNISYSAFGSPQEVSLNGIGAAPAVNLNPAALTFGDQPVGTTSAPQYVTMTNAGDATLTITSIAASGDFAEINTCGTTLLSGQDCTLIVTFTPTQTGTRTGAITITDNALDSPQSVPLTGTGD